MPGITQLGLSPGTISNSVGTQDTSPGLCNPQFLRLYSRDTDTTLMGFICPACLGHRTLSCAPRYSQYLPGETLLCSQGLLSQEKSKVWHQTLFKKMAATLTERHRGHRTIRRREALREGFRMWQCQNLRSLKRPGRGVMEAVQAQG